jgi:hypothetical protein
MDRLRADVARLTLSVRHARLDRDRDSLRALLFHIILLGAAAFPNLLAELIMAAIFPVFFLARKAAVARFAAAALLGGQGWQRGSAAGAVRQNHSFLTKPCLCCTHNGLLHTSLLQAFDPSLSGSLAAQLLV